MSLDAEPQGADPDYYEVPAMELRKAASNSGPERQAETVRTVPNSNEVAGGSPAEVNQSVNERLQDAKEASQRRNILARAAHNDSINLSDVALLFTTQNDQVDFIREDLIQELRQAYNDGNLNSPERLEAAASRLLGDS